MRDYQGRRHTVTVEREGYVWEGKSYSSLSAIARAITGTAWSGPRFFALKPSPAARSGMAERAKAARSRRAARHLKQQSSTAEASNAPPL